MEVESARTTSCILRHVVFTSGYGGLMRLGNYVYRVAVSQPLGLARRKALSVGLHR